MVNDRALGRRQDQRRGVSCLRSDPNPKGFESASSVPYRTQCALQGVSRRDFDMVAAWSVDRLGRSLQDLVGFLGELHPCRPVSTCPNPGDAGKGRPLCATLTLQPNS